MRTAVLGALKARESERATLVGKQIGSTLGYGTPIVTQSTNPPQSTQTQSSVRGCPKCGTAMLLFGIEPDGPEHELQSFDCPKCQHIEAIREKSA